MNSPTSPFKPSRFRDSRKVRRVVTASVKAGVVEVRISNRDGRDEYRQLGIANFAVTDLEAVVAKLGKLLMQIRLDAQEAEANYQLDEEMKEGENDHE